MDQQRVAGAGEVRPVNRIVVPVAGTDREFIVQEQAVLFAASLEVPIVAVHVVGATDIANGNLYDYIDKVAATHNVEIEHHTLDGNDAASVLLEEVEAMDLVVIGSEKIGGRYHFSSVAERLITQAPCPVQVVRLTD